MESIVKRLLENHRKSESIAEAYKIRYSYEGDSISDYEGNLIVVADSEDEAFFNSITSIDKFFFVHKKYNS